MANRTAPFTQADVTRAVKGAVAAGLRVREVIASAEGVRLVLGGDETVATGKSKSWEDLINEAP